MNCNGSGKPPHEAEESQSDRGDQAPAGRGGTVVFLDTALRKRRVGVLHIEDEGPDDDPGPSAA